MWNLYEELMGIKQASLFFLCLVCRWLRLLLNIGCLHSSGCLCKELQSSLPLICLGSVDMHRDQQLDYLELALVWNERVWKRLAP